MYFFMCYLGVGMGKIACTPIFYSYFSCRTWNVPSFVSFFLYDLVSKGCISLPLYPFLPKARPFTQPPWCMHTQVPSLGSPLWWTRTLPYFILQGDILSSDGFKSILGSILTSSCSRPYCFLGLLPKMCHPALLRFGINFFFTYRWFEGYIHFLPSS